VKWKHRWKGFPGRDWESVRDTWLSHIPVFDKIPSPPDPGLEHLSSLLELTLDKLPARFPDVVGARANNLSEAIYLFHKCSHANLAAQRLAMQGMHSWCLFNAYHSAYLGAKGIMAMLGLAFPMLSGTQVAIDFFPEPEGKTRKGFATTHFDQFRVILFPKIDQGRLWEGFQRVLRTSQAHCWDAGLVREILDVNEKAITPPRNSFLYRADYWPCDDLTSDVSSSAMDSYAECGLDNTNHGFLLRLSFLVYLLFEQLVSDLGNFSSLVKIQAEASRCMADTSAVDLELYRVFLSGVPVLSVS
jgi:hypothetical protein